MRPWSDAILTEVAFLMALCFSPSVEMLCSASCLTTPSETTVFLSADTSWAMLLSVLPLEGIL